VAPEECPTFHHIRALGIQCFGTTITSRPRFNIFTLEPDLANEHYRRSNATIEHQSWEKIVTKYDRPHTLFYCDPPYWQTEGYGVEFGFEHYERMAELARSIKGHMIISINDHPDIRAVFSDLPVIEIDYQYTVGGNGKPSDCVELVFGNWEETPTPKGQQGLF